MYTYNTKQQVFDAILAHSRSMTEKSESTYGFDSNYGSSYRGKNGNKCFIGALIPDNLYDSSIEGKRGCLVLERYIDKQTIINPVLITEWFSHFTPSDITTNRRFNPIQALDVLQEIHDNYFEDREEKLELFARVENLNYTKPNE